MWSLLLAGMPMLLYFLYSPISIVLAYFGILLLCTLVSIFSDKHRWY